MDPPGHRRHRLERRRQTLASQRPHRRCPPHPGPPNHHALIALHLLSSRPEARVFCGPQWRDRGTIAQSHSRLVISPFWSAAACRRFFACCLANKPQFIQPQPFLRSSPSSRPERPEFFFRADLWRVGPRSGGITAQSTAGTVTLDCALGFVFKLWAVDCRLVTLLCALCVLPSASSVFFPLSLSFSPKLRRRSTPHLILKTYN